MEFSHIEFGIKVIESSNFGSYVYQNCCVVTEEPLEFKGVQLQLEFQNGHTYLGNDYNCPSNKLIVWTENSDIPEILLYLYEQEDEEFIDFLQDVCDQANNYLSSHLLSESKESKIIDFWRNEYNGLNGRSIPEHFSQFDLFEDKTAQEVLESL